MEWREKKTLQWVLQILLWGGLLNGLFAGGSSGVEIFRIGGSNESPPNQQDLNFHHLQWSAFEEQFGLDAEGLEEGILRPIFVRPGENIAFTSLARDGGPYVQVGHGRSSLVTDESMAMVDGDLTSFYEWLEVSIQNKFITQEFIQPHLISVDLGGLFLVNRIRLVTLAEHHFPDVLDVGANSSTKLTPGIGSFRSRSGFIDASSRLEGDVVHRVPENVNHIIDVSFAPSLARSVDLLLHRRSPQLVRVAEVEIYGQGYINQSTYISSFIDLEEPAIWGNIRWRGRRDRQAKIFIQTRAGRDLDPNQYWRFTGRSSEATPFDKEGRLLDRAAFARLKPGEAGEITYDRENWSFWSPPYDFADSSGTFVLSPSPNSVFQLKVDLLLTTTDGGELDFIEFSATRPPLAEEILGEIYPPDVALGQTVQFVYAIEATIRAQHSGFDRIEISTPFGLGGVDAVKIGRVEVALDSEILAADSTLFAVNLPRHLQAGDSGELVEVIFRAPVLRYGTPFTGWVRDSQRPLELAQRINPGNAADELASEVLSVRTSLSQLLLANLLVEPRILTPNSDGVNELVAFSFNLLQVTDAVPLRLEIFDLSGRLVRVMEEVLPGSGRFNFSWDGRDGGGQLVVPGLYVYRIAVRVERGEDQRSGTLAVVY